MVSHLGEKSGLIFLPGSPSLEYEDSDQEVVMRQLRYFYYLSGLDLPDCAVTYDIKRDTLCAFIPPPRVGRTIIYIGQNPSPEEIKAEYEFDDVKFVTDLGVISQTLSITIPLLRFFFSIPTRHQKKSFAA